MDLFGSFFKKNDPISRAIEDAIALMESNRYDEALAVLRDRALAEDPDHERARLHTGLAHMLKGEYDAAESYVRPIAEKKALDSESATAAIIMDTIQKKRNQANG